MLISYINTDLDLIATENLTPLARALRARGVFPLHVGREEDGLWYARFETNNYVAGTPEETISAMLTAVESLGDNARVLWSLCSLREFNIGYDCGDEPREFNNGLTNETLRRVVEVGASLRITLYPPDTSGPPPQPAKTRKKTRVKKPKSR